jgi:aryl-alcohol dehydrogenase-like predicted oxidoreductase
MTVCTSSYHHRGTTAVMSLLSTPGTPVPEHELPPTKEPLMRSRTIGPVTVSAIGLGGMPMSIEGRPDERRSIRTIHAALDAGVTLIDTADAYHLHAGETGHNERLIATALASYGGDTSRVLVATKGGHLRPGDGSWTVDGSPEHLRAAADASLKALGVEAIGLYQFHRPDPSVPYEESIGALKELQEAGKIRLAGISNASVGQIAVAQRVLGDGNLASVQNQFSPAFRSSEDELRYCAGQQIAFLPWSPLGGIGRAGRLGTRHAVFQQIADAHRVSPQQVTLAWMLAKAPVVIPIPGASRPESITDSARAAGLELSAAEIARLDAS